jgi:hypothetical protein
MSGQDVTSQKQILVLHLQNYNISERFLEIRVYQLLNASTDSSIDSSRKQSHSHRTHDPTDSEENGFTCIGYRIAAHDDMENEYALFVPKKKAQDIYKASCNYQDVDIDLLSPRLAISKLPQDVAELIVAHLDIVGNLHRDVGKLVCTEPTPVSQKKIRTLPVDSAVAKQIKAQRKHVAHERRQQMRSRLASSPSTQGIRTPVGEVDDLIHPDRMFQQRQQSHGK